MIVIDFFIVFLKSEIKPREFLSMLYCGYYLRLYYLLVFTGYEFYL